MLIDMHCDTISGLLDRGDRENLLHNTVCVNVERMKQAEIWIQYFACFVNAGRYERELQQRQGLPGEAQAMISANWIRTKGGTEISSLAWEMAWQEVQKLLERLQREESEQIRIIGSCSEAEEICPYKQHLQKLYGETKIYSREQNQTVKNRCKNRLAAFPTVEEGGMLNGKLSRLEELYEKGVRLITLSWNYENCLGYPNSRDEDIMNQGLKSFGLKVVDRMNELGMMIDVSHLSDGGFWDCIQRSKAPIVASHSNARALCAHPRNLSGEMLRALAEKGGVAGLNFYPAFLREDGLVTTADIAGHAAYMINTAGEDVVAVGTDFDGFETDIREGYVSHPGEMERVWEACKKAGITERQLDKICWQNAWRVMKDVLHS